jgi:hypothetical protein
MHIRPKTYLHLMSRLRGVRVALARRHGPADQHVSPLLIFIAIVLTLLLAMLEVDLHSAELRALGLLGDPNAANSVLFGP